MGSLLGTSFPEFSSLIIMGVLLTLAASYTGRRWLIGPGIFLMAVVILIAAVYSPGPIGSSMAYLPLLFLAASLVNRGILRREIDSQVHGDSGVEAGMQRVQDRTIMISVTAVGASYLTSLLLLQAGLLLSLGLASEWTAFLLAAALLASVALLAGLPRGRGTEEQV